MRIFCFTFVRCLFAQLFNVVFLSLAQIISRMIERLDQPLDTSEATLYRINAKLGLPPPHAAPPQTAPNESAQVIYDTVAKAERLFAALLAIEQELHARNMTISSQNFNTPSGLYSHYISLSTLSLSSLHSLSFAQNGAEALHHRRQPYIAPFSFPLLSSRPPSLLSPPLSSLPSSSPPLSPTHKYVMQVEGGYKQDLW